MKLFQELTWRGLIYETTDPDIGQALEKTSMTFYLGADPTANSLHVGHLQAYIFAKRLADAGHHPILVIGGGTGLVGDPSFKKNERKLLSIEESLENAKGIAAQAKHLLPKATIINNYDWLSTLNAIEFLRDVGKHFNVSYMMSKDSVKSRIDSGISFTEFAYQIIQAWDFEHLYKHHECQMQIGGQDQWGNITAGLELIRKIHGSDAKAYGMTFPLVTKEDGTKFGKTEEGAVWLDKERTSPYAFYQFWLNTSDADAIDRLKQFTFLSRSEIETIAEQFEKAPHERLAQKTLARELTAMVHGNEALDQAEKITDALFSGDIQSLTADDIAMGFRDLPSMDVKDKVSLDVALLKTGLVSSKREAREMIKNNAVSVNGDKVTDTYFTLEKKDAIDHMFTVIRKGKKKYALIRHRGE